MLDPEIKGRLLAVRAKAAAIAGFYEEAVERFTESLQILPGRLSPEPLIRLHLLRDDLKRAREAFERYKFPPQSDVELPLRLLLETLGSDRKPCAKTLDRMDKPNSPEGHLYQGLLLNLASKNETAFPYLQEYLSRVRWGEDLASRVLLPLTSPDCAMCRAEKATTHWDGAPVCRPCNELLTCEPWKDQAFLQPTPEQKRLLENILGENADFAQELFAVNTPIETQCEVSFSPSISLSELLPKLDPVSGEAWQEAETLARERARNVVGTGELGLILVRNSEEARDLFRGDEAQRFLIEFGERPEEESDDESKPASMELLWVLNVANWLNTNLPPFRKNGISIRDLAWALDLTRALPGTRASGFVAMVMGDRLAARQRDYFEELVVHRPNSLFLRSVLSGRSRYDFRPESYAQSTQHRLWIIRNCPSTYPRHSIDYAPALDFYQIVLAWSETIQNFADDPQVLAKGAELFSLEDDILKQALLCRCRALDPENTEWKVELAIDLDYAVEDERDQVQVAASCLELMQPYLSQASEPTRTHLLTDFSLLIHDVEGPERGKNLATELLEISKRVTDWNTANAWHKAHTILGMLAIRECNLPKAGKHLLLSSRKGDSPQLRTLGPNMRLAKALLDSGEWEVVEEFLEFCSDFWDSDELDHWMEQVAVREMPLFEFNLWY